MRCTVCQKELPESEFYQSRLKNHQHICKKCCCAREKEYRNKDILNDSDRENFGFDNSENIYGINKIYNVKINFFIINFI